MRLQTRWPQDQCRFQMQPGPVAGSTEQASSLEELTASIHEIAEQTKRNALNANERRVCKVSLEKASEGNQQMVEMLQAMQAINESSQTYRRS